METIGTAAIRYCKSCSDKERVTIIEDDKHKGGGYYYCHLCEGAVEITIELPVELAKEEAKAA